MGCNFCFGKHLGENQMNLEITNENKENSKLQKLKARAKKRNEDEEIEEIKFPEKNISSIQVIDQIECISSIFNNIVLGLFSGNIIIYNLTGNKLEEKYTITMPLSHNGCVKCIIPLQDGRFASSGGDGKIKIWINNSFYLSKDLNPHDDWINCMFQPLDTNLLISGSSDKTIKILDLDNNGYCNYTYNVDENVDNLVDLFDGKFASSSGDNVSIWDLKTKTLLLKFEGNHNSIVSLEYIKNINLLIAGEETGNIKGYDMNEKNNKFVIRDTSDDNLYCMSIINDSIIATGNGNSIKLWNINSQQEIRTLSGHSLDIKAICFTKNLLFTGGNDKILKIWE